LGYLGDWRVDSESLRENQGVGMSAASYSFETGGEPNELSFTDSCFNAPDWWVQWGYEVTYAVVDLLAYGNFDYADPAKREVAILNARESYNRLDSTTMELLAESSGEAEDGSPLTFTVTGTLTTEE
jgi:hypothetical protein